ncbi:MAG TPA: iron-sulfur cluster assembly protein, partial [Gammaproteobacteria bacterium]|nr:iron-sulfur cluster assembly protein [Gammaproteobacteria bacterium]
MNDVTREQIESALRGWKEPYLDSDLVSANSVRGIEVKDGSVSVELELGFPADGYTKELGKTVRT